MKYCLSSRQKYEYLKKADSIKVAFRDKNIIPDLIEKYPNAEIVLIINREKDEKFTWNDVRMWGVLAQGRLVCCLQSMSDMEECKKIKVGYYWGYPVNNYYDLRTLKDAGVSYVRLEAPLFFEMDEVKKFGVPVRAVPNVAHLNDIPTKNGIYGTWIRPDDIDLYEEYIAVCEFEDCDIKKEGALYKVYAEQKIWGGPLALLISNIETKAENHLIQQEGTKIRLNCGQKCQKNGKCHICERLLRLADSQKLQEYLDTVKGKDND